MDSGISGKCAEERPLVILRGALGLHLAPRPTRAAGKCLATHVDRR
jgi:hypothetical protein